MDTLYVSAKFNTTRDAIEEAALTELGKTLNGVTFVVLVCRNVDEVEEEKV